MGKCLLIIGMHRSGTSLTSSILQRAGLFIGDELMGASVGNAKGHFENVDFYTFHMKAFENLSLNRDGWDLSSVDKLRPELDEEAITILEKNEREEWGWKDPRTTLFLPYWEKKISSAKYLFVYRNPWEVVDSLYRRGSDSKIMENASLAFKAWNFYNREIIAMYKKHEQDSILIHIDDLVENIPGFISTLNDRLGFHLNNEGVEDIFDKDIYMSSDKTFLRSLQTDFVFPEVMETLNELRALNGKPAFELPDQNELKQSSSDEKQVFIYDWQKVYALKKEINDWKQKIEDCKTEMTTMQLEIEYHKKEIENHKKEIDWMTKSKFWKLRSLLQRMRTAS